MRKLFKLFGHLVYYAAYPLWALYLNKDERTRVVVKCGEEVLLVKSWIANGKWDLPGGGLHKGEDPATGAARELQEELGLPVKALELSFLQKAEFRSGLLRYPLHYFEISLKTKPSLKLQTAELAEARWFNAKEMKRLKLQPGLYSAVRQSVN